MERPRLPTCLPKRTANYQRRLNRPCLTISKKGPFKNFSVPLWSESSSFQPCYSTTLPRLHELTPLSLCLRPNLCSRPHMSTDVVAALPPRPSTPPNMADRAPRRPFPQSGLSPCQLRPVSMSANLACRAPSPPRPVRGLADQLGRAEGGGIGLYRRAQVAVLGILGAYTAGVVLSFLIDLIFFFRQGHPVHTPPI